MKNLLLLAVALVFSATCATAQISNVKIENDKGELVSVASMVDGKTPMIISFWSTTCKPCIRELNTINDVMIDWKEMANFRVIAVSVDDSRSASKAKAMAAGNGWEDITVLYDKNQELKRAMNVNSIPQVFVVDGTGKIVYAHTGYTPGCENELLKVIKEHQTK
ncbi:MAG: TlpA disulfide reductase family protein [Alistipes sp.]